MKKFLHKSCAWLVMLVAWFAVSMTAMAQDETFSVIGKSYGSDPVSGTSSLGVKWTSNCTKYLGGANFYAYATDYFILEAPTGKVFTKVVLSVIDGTVNGVDTQDKNEVHVGSFDSSTATWTGTSSYIKFYTTAVGNRDWTFNEVSVWLTDEGSGSGGGEQPGGSTDPEPTTTTSTLNFNNWNLTYSGGSSKPASSTHFNNGEVFSNADGVTMTLTGIPATQSWPSECFYSNPAGSDMALYLANTEGFDIAAPTGKKISKIVVAGYNTNSYPLTSLKADGVAFTASNNATWTGDAESVSFSTISGDATKRVLIQTITVTLIDANGEGGGEQPEPVVEYATFDHASPAAGTISLDEKPDGLSYFQIYFEEKLVEDFGTYTGQTLPAGFTLTDSNGVAQSFKYVQGWASDEWTDYKNFSFETTEALKTPGTYTLHVPAGLFTFEGGKVNPELDLEWTLTAATKFEVSGQGVEPTGEEKANGGYKTLTGFTISAPNGVIFDHIASDAKVQQRTGYDENYNDIYTDVEATITLNATDNTVSITFPTAYTEKGSYSMQLAEGSIVATDGRVSKKVSLSASVDPMEYFSITADPADGSTYEGLLNTLKITVPAGITVTGLSTTNKINFGGWLVDPTSWSQEGNVVTLVFPDDKAGQPGNQYFWYGIPEGFFTTSDPFVTNNTLYAYNINIKEVVIPMTVEKMLMVDGGEPVVSGATVDKLSYFYIYLNEPLAEDGDVWDIPAGMTLTDANGQTYNWSYVYGYAGGRYNSDNCVVVAKLSDPDYYTSGIQTAGTYTLHIPAGAYTSATGHPSEEINYTFVIEDKVIKLASAVIDDTVGGMGAPTLTFDNDVLVTSSYPEADVVALFKGNTMVDLEGLSYVQLQTNSNHAYVYIYDSNYTTFFPLEAGDYTLRIAGKYFTSITGNPYSEAEYIEVPFTVTAPADLAISAESEGKYYATYYNGKHNWIVPAGVTAYWVSGVDGTSVTLEVAANANEVVNSSVAVLLVSNEAITAPLAYTTDYSNNYYNNNLLRGVAEDRLVENSSWDTQYTFYMLSKKDGAVGFYWDPSTNDEGASINAKAHKAYLRVPVESGDAPSNLRINFGGEEPTGINAVIASDASNAIFNLQGQRVAAPVKGGVYVKNGKKIIVK